MRTYACAAQTQIADRARPWQAIFAQFLQLLPAFAGLLGALCALFTVYAQLGVLLFGGRCVRRHSHS